MLKKILVGGLVFVLAASIGLFFWARAVFTQDNVRAALGRQLSKAIGQPVEVGGISASIYPRVTVHLKDVEIGQPARVHVQALDVGTDFRALLSRRIEHGAVLLDGAKVELPLPAFTVGSSDVPETSGEPGAPPVEIVSIDEIVLRNVEITSGGRSLRGDVEVVPRGAGVELRKAALTAGGATVDVTGQITNLSGPVGELSLKAGALNFDDLLAFAADFAGGIGSTATGTGQSTNAGAPSTAAPKPAASASTMDLTMALDAESATMGGLALQKVSGRARITPRAVSLSPIRFGVFGGTYDGELTLQPGETARFNVKAAMANIDVAAVTKFGGSPDVITGRLSGKFDISGAGIDPGTVIKSTNGTARVDITNGVVKHLGLVNAIVTATSGRAGALSAAASRGAAADEPFARLGATLAIDGGVASTKDLRFESNDVLLSASGVVHLDGSATALAGQVQLSDQLSQQAGRDLVRYTQEGGRVTLPATVSGPADDPQVRIDVSSLARRAITNKATEEVKKGLGRIFGR